MVIPFPVTILPAKPFVTDGVFPIGVNAAGQLKRAAFGSLTPEMYVQANETVGAGDIDDTVLTRWVAACNAAGIPAAGTSGKTYRCSSALTLTFKVPFDGNGCEFTVPNDGQSNALIKVDSFDGDIETVDLSTVNSWTGLHYGSRRIPELTEKGWSYTLIDLDTPFLLRAGGSGGNAMGESFQVVDGFGYLQFPITNTFSLPLSNISCTRRRVRDLQTLENFTIRVVTGTDADMIKVFENFRPRTLFRSAHIINESGQNIKQGFVSSICTEIYFEHCHVSGLGEVSQEYSFGAGYCTGVYLSYCSAVDCRRNFDGTGMFWFFATDCIFPNAVGAHWGRFGRFTRCTIGHRDNTTPSTAHFSGGDIHFIDCDFHLSSGGPLTSLAPVLINMRDDLPEWSGAAVVRGGKVTVYDFDNEIPTGKLIYFMRFNGLDNFDYVRDTHLPNRVVFEPDLVEIIGDDSDNNIVVLAYGAPKLASEIPNHVVSGGKITINPGAIVMGASQLVGGNPRFQVILYRGETQKGNDTDVLIKGIDNPDVFCSPRSATLLSGHETEGRYNIIVEGAQELSRYILRVSAAKEVRLRECKSVPPSKLDRGDPTATLGDEAIDFEAFGLYHQGMHINPFGAINQRGNNVPTDGTYGPDGWIALTDGGVLSMGSVGGVTDTSVPFMVRLNQTGATPKKIGMICYMPSRQSIAARYRAVSMVARVLRSEGGKINYALGEWAGSVNAPTRDQINDWADTVLTPGHFFKATDLTILATGQVDTGASDSHEVHLQGHVSNTCQNLFLVIWTDTVVAQDHYLQAAADIFLGFYRPLARVRTDEAARCYEWYRKKSLVTTTTSKYVPLDPPMQKTPVVDTNVSTPSGTATVSHLGTDGFDVIADTSNINTVIGIAGDI